jgi:hypothetical protein
LGSALVDAARAITPTPPPQPSLQGEGAHRIVGASSDPSGTKYRPKAVQRWAKIDLQIPFQSPITAATSLPHAPAAS